jgi:hypothetical protein
MSAYRLARLRGCDLSWATVRRAQLWIAVGLLAGLVVAARPVLGDDAVTKIWLDGGDDDADLRRFLLDELPPGTLITTTVGADLRMVVRRAPDALVVELADLGGQTAVRRFSTTNAVQPALRRVALLATRAQRALSEAFTESDLAVESSVAPPAASTPLAIEAGWSFRWWTTPLRPEQGPTVAASFALGRFTLGGRAILGLPMVARSARGITGDAYQVAGLGEAGLDLASFGPVGVALEAAAGVEWLSVNVTGREWTDPADAAVQNKSAAHPLARVGLAARLVAFDGRVFGQVHAGAEAHPPFEIQLPVVPSVYSADTLNSGTLVPFVDLGVGLSL